MLKRVYFWLSKEAACSLRGAIEKLIKNLAQYGLKVEVLEMHCARQLYADTEQHFEEWRETLHITDQPSIYAVLREHGRYVLPYYHEYNYGMTFSGAFYAIEKLEETDYESLNMAYRRLAGLPWDILETDRLRVRETMVEDVDSFYEIYEKPSITAYMEDLFPDRDEEIAYTKDYIEKVYTFYGYGMWTILKKDSKEVIGRAGISWREGYELPELGFVIGVPWQGQGYAFEVCASILAYAREELQMERVQVLVQPGNEKSLKLCERLGFIFSGKTELDGVGHLVLVRDL